MGGGPAYTTDPALGVHGEGAVPDAELAAFAHRAAMRPETASGKRPALEYRGGWRSRTSRDVSCC